MNVDRMLEKIGKCARTRGIAIDSEIFMKLVDRVYDCKARAEIVSCQECERLPDCAKFGELLEVANLICRNCRIRENCGKIGDLLVWLNCII